MVPDAPGFAIDKNHKITKEQKFALYDLIDYAKETNRGVDAKFYVDVYGGWTGPVSYQYDIDTVSVQRIMRDLEPVKDRGMEK